MPISPEVLGEALTDRTIQFAQSIAVIATAAREASANDALSLGIAASICTHAPDDAFRRQQMAIGLAAQVRRLLMRRDVVEWVKGWLSCAPSAEPEFPQVLIALIDALRDYLFVCERDNAGLLREEAITLEDVERDAPRLARCRALPAELARHQPAVPDRTGMEVSHGHARPA